MYELDVYQGPYDLGTYTSGDEKLDVEFSYKIVETKLLGAEGYTDHLNFGFETEYDHMTDFEFDPTIEEDHKKYYLLAAASGVLCASTQKIICTLIEDSEKSLSKLWTADKRESDKEKLEKLLKVYNTFNKNSEDVTVSGLINKLLRKSDVVTEFMINELMGGRIDEIDGLESCATSIGLLAALAEQFYGQRVVIRYDEKKGFYIKLTRHKKTDSKNKIGKGVAQKIEYAIINWIFGAAMHVGKKKVEDLTENGLPEEVANLIVRLSEMSMFESIQQKYFEDSSELASAVDEHLKKLGIKFNITNEIQVNSELTKQVLPVVLNDVIVRTFYSIFKFANLFSGRSITSLTKEDLKLCLPIAKDNRLLTRMLTISSGIFSATDIVCAMVKAKLKHEPFASCVQSINFVGFGRFVFAIAVDADYIKEDIQELFKKKEEAVHLAKDNVIETIDIESSLPVEQTRVVKNMIYRMVHYDIRCDQAKDPAVVLAKNAWLSKWVEQNKEEFNQLKEELGNVPFDELFIEKDKEFIAYIDRLIERYNDTSWLKVVILCALVFKPYEKIGVEESEEVKGTKKKLKFGLNLKKDPLEKAKYDPMKYIEQFSTQQTYVLKEETFNLDHTYDDYYEAISGKKKNQIVKTVNMVGVGAAAGIAAAAFAPAIAVAAVGAFGGANGLAGAALVNHCLAVIGGGAIAAGGLGMAGGTAIIAGSGAMIGLVGGGAISGATLNLAILKEDHLKNWCIYLTISKMQYIFSPEGIEKIKHMYEVMNTMEIKVSYDIQTMKDSLKYGDFDDTKEGKNAKNSEKLMLKSTEESLTYIQNTKKELQKLLNSINQ